MRVVVSLVWARQGRRQTVKPFDMPIRGLRAGALSAASALFHPCVFCFVFVRRSILYPIFIYIIYTDFMPRFPLFGQAVQTIIRHKQLQNIYILRSTENNILWKAKYFRRIPELVANLRSPRLSTQLGRCTAIYTGGRNLQSSNQSTSFSTRQRLKNHAHDRQASHSQTA